MVSRHRISEPCLTVQLSGLLGYVDYLGRPIVRLSIVGLQDEVPALVDTGCNMNVVASRSIAREAGLVTTGIREGGELAAGFATFGLRGSARSAQYASLLRPTALAPPPGEKAGAPEQETRDSGARDRPRPDRGRFGKGPSFKMRLGNERLAACGE